MPQINQSKENWWKPSNQYLCWYFWFSKVQFASGPLRVCELCDKNDHGNDVKQNDMQINSPVEMKWCITFDTCRQCASHMMPFQYNTIQSLSDILYNNGNLFVAPKVGQISSRNVFIFISEMKWNQIIFNFNHKMQLKIIVELNIWFIVHWTQREKRQICL